jgi:hypothetical protein
VTWLTAVPHNSWPTNVLLITILLLFVVVGGDEARRAIGPLLGR